MTYVLMFAFAIGLVAGLRSLTAPAAVTWAAHLGFMNLNGSIVAFMGSTTAVVLFSLLALFELFGDKWPRTPKRTALAPLAARILMGGLCGACLCASSGKSLVPGAILGGLGGLIAAFAGYEIRKGIVANLYVKDLWIAICEDLLAIGVACFVVFR